MLLFLFVYLFYCFNDVSPIYKDNEIVLSLWEAFSRQHNFFCQMWKDAAIRGGLKFLNSFKQNKGPIYIEKYKIWPKIHLRKMLLFLFVYLFYCFNDVSPICKDNEIVLSLWEASSRQHHFFVKLWKDAAIRGGLNSFMTEQRSNIYRKV
jgi:hypothetical protein